MQVDPSPPSTSADTTDNDLYQQIKSLEHQLDFIDHQEEYLKDKMRGYWVTGVPCLDLKSYLSVLSNNNQSHRGIVDDS